MPFKDTKEGQTHSQNDNCGDPEHNDMPNKPTMVIEQIEYLISEMKKAQAEHPKARVYYDWEDAEIRITYPLPKDYPKFTPPIKN